MSAPGEVVRLDEGEMAEWDAFVEASPQGTVFSTSAFVRSLGTPYSIWAVRDGGVIQGGVVCLEDAADRGAMHPGIFEFTPYQGVLVRPAASPRRSRQIDHEFRQTEALVRHLAERYTRIFIANSWLLRDVRPFTWHTHAEPDPARRFRVDVRYTALSELSDAASVRRGMRDGHREALKAAGRAGMETRPGGDFETFRALYLPTFQKQGIALAPETMERAARIYAAMDEAGRSACWTTYLDGRAVSLGYFLLDTKRAYYLWGCSDPEALRLGCSVRNLHDSQVGLLETGVRELDWVGVNSPRRGFFKQGFGGAVVPYFLLARDGGPAPLP
ncbi:MAG TPA: GNAT family N-acetyltransferase [Longimicrobium sp.]|nr:GNAT family N-acetyltransferase [Longimicrobium sp.]